MASSGFLGDWGVRALEVPSTPPEGQGPAAQRQGPAAWGQGGGGQQAQLRQEPLKPETTEDLTQEGCGGACFEPEQKTTKTAWTFVGEGKGNYEKLPQYNYLGAGCGSCEGAVTLQRQLAGLWSRCSIKAAIPFAIGISLVLVFFFLAQILGAAVHGKAIGSMRRTNAEGLTFDCDSAEAMWPQEQMDFCCGKLGRGCTTSLSEPFDCMAGFHMWETAWSAGQKDWCCDNYRRGCQVTTTPVPYDCEAGFPDAVPSWPDDKAAWCCAHERAGCPDGPDAAGGAAPPAEFHDCQKDFASWDVAWDVHKKAWCCEHENVGCPTLAPTPAPAPPPTPAPAPASTRAPRVVPTLAPRATAEYDCYNGLAASWGQAQENWCCTHRQICFKGTDAETMAPVKAAGGSGCSAMCTYGHATASCAARIHWLVNHGLRAQPDACATALVKVQSQCPECSSCTEEASQCVPAQPYDCGVQQPGMVWSQPKSQWCCAHKGVCKSDATAAATHFDCNEGYSNWEKGWAIKKKAWCCIHAGKACPPKETMAKLPFAATSYDCEAGLPNWQREWSVKKKAWCCINQKKGCDQ